MDRPDITPVAQSLLGDHRKWVSENQQGSNNKDILKLALLRMGIGLGNRALQRKSNAFMNQEALMAQRIQHNTALTNFEAAEAERKAANAHAGGATDYWMQRNIPVIQAKFQDARGPGYDKVGMAHEVQARAESLAMEQQAANTKIVQAGRGLSSREDFIKYQEKHNPRARSVGDWVSDRVMGVFGGKSSEEQDEIAIKSISNSGMFKTTEAVNTLQSVYRATKDVRKSRLVAAGAERAANLGDSVFKVVSTIPKSIKISLPGRSTESTLNGNIVKKQNEWGVSHEVFVPNKPNDMRLFRLAGSLETDETEISRETFTKGIPNSTGVPRQIEFTRIVTTNGVGKTTTEVPTKDEDQEWLDLQGNQTRVTTNSQTQRSKDGKRLVGIDTITSIDPNGVVTIVRDVTDVPGFRSEFENPIQAERMSKVTPEDSQGILIALDEIQAEGDTGFLDGHFDSFIENNTLEEEEFKSFEVKRVVVMAQDVRESLGVSQTEANRIAMKVYIDRVRGIYDKDDGWFIDSYNKKEGEGNGRYNVPISPLEAYMAHVELAASNPTMSHAKYTKSMMQDFEGFDQTDRERILQEVKNNPSRFKDLFQSDSTGPQKGIAPYKRMMQIIQGK